MRTLVHYLVAFTVSSATTYGLKRVFLPDRKAERGKLFAAGELVVQIAIAVAVLLALNARFPE